MGKFSIFSSVKVALHGNEYGEQETHPTISFVISALHEYLNCYLKQTNVEGYLFWFMAESYIRYKLDFLDEDKIEKLDNISPNWKDHVRKELNLNDRHVKKWRKRFSDFNHNKETGILIILYEQKLGLYY